jgi:hypothetical protein
MRIGKAALNGLVLALAMLARVSPVSAQTVDAPPPTWVLATRLVQFSDYSADGFMIGMREAFADIPKTYDDDLPQDVKDWMTVAFAGAAEHLADDITPALDQQLVELFATNFTVEELQQVLDFEEYLHQPRIAAAMDKAREETTADAADAVMRANLPAEDYEKITILRLKPPISNVTMLSLKAKAAAAIEFKERFDGALLPYCPTAPKGVLQCERQGRPL